MKFPKYIFLLLFVVSLVGCKSTKTLASGNSDFSLNKKQVIREHFKRTPDFKTLQCKIKIDYKNGDDEQSYSATLRIEKDKTIWISATLNLVRVLITPERVSFYNKLDNTYFDGDFSYLSDLLGTEIDFQKARLDSQQVAQNLEHRMMEVDYLSYQVVGKQVFPEKLKVLALEKSNETIIGLEFKSINLNEELRFPYNIPSGFKKIEL